MEDIKDIIQKQREFFASGKTKEAAFRIKYLRLLENSILSHEKDILTALKKDLNKASFEAYATEVGMVLSELSFMIRKLTGWSKPKRIKTTIVNQIASSKVYPEPYGIALIMSPWNYPFQLTMEPLIGAIAAGNCVVVKPSKDSPYTSEVIEVVLKEVFPKSYVTVVQGGREANLSLLEQKFDYIFFTGSPTVGKVVMEAAAKHLTPITLELGGKSPCIVDETANLELAAKRIVWGKFINAGQTCVAPDYLLVHPAIKEQLLQKMKSYIIQFYGKHPCSNENYPKIINEKHYHRLLNLIEGEDIVIGGNGSLITQQIEPTILDHITWNSEIMKEEIFGPILPVLEFRDLSEIIKNITDRPKPLAFYYFTESKTNERRLLRNISFGGGCINDTLMHLVTSYMPFGGVGESGMGRYHGKASFDTFSHQKSILKKSTKLDIPLRYPPYRNNWSLVKKLMK
jgi:aldehyde dehydrogenase (NAD+)